MKKVIAYLLSVCLVVSMSSSALAASDSEVKLTQSVSKLSVTIPTGLPIIVDQDGKTTTGVPKITNTSVGPVVLDSVRVDMTSDWEIVTGDASGLSPGSKKLSMKLVEDVNTDGTVSLTGTPAPIYKDDVVTLLFEASVAPQTEVINEAIANAIFVVDWYTAKVEPPVTGIDLSQTTAALEVGGTLQLTATAKYRAAATWSSDNETVASVDQTGLVTANGAGECMVSVSIGDVTATCTINVTAPIPLAGLEISPYGVVEVGAGAALKAAKLPANTTNTEPVVWSSSNESVATVTADGVTKGVSVGSAQISATVAGFTQTCDIQVKAFDSSTMKVMQSFTEINRDFWRADKYRENIVSVDFIDEMVAPPGAIQATWDVSADKNGSVLAWISKNAVNSAKYDLTIAAKGGVYNVGEHSFNNCLGLERISWSDGISMIGVSSFQNCAKLDFSSFPSKGVTIDSSAFSGCSSLTVESLPAGSKIIRGNAFAGCSSLKTMYLPDGLHTLAVGAFQNCTKLESIRLPKSLNTIAVAFSGCSNLSSIRYSGTATGKPWGAPKGIGIVAPEVTP